MSVNSRFTCMCATGFSGEICEISKSLSITIQRIYRSHVLAFNPLDPMDFHPISSNSPGFPQIFPNLKQISNVTVLPIGIPIYLKMISFVLERTIHGLKINILDPFMHFLECSLLENFGKMAVFPRGCGRSEKILHGRLWLDFGL